MSCPVNVYQNPVEMAGLMDILTRLSPKRILEIGSLYGGTLWHWMEVFPGAEIVSIDLIAVDVPKHPIEKIRACRALWSGWAKHFGCSLREITTPSGHPETMRQALEQAPYDFIFVDGGHQYLQVSSDFTNYWPMLRAGGVMAFHDVAYADDWPGIGVGTWWREIVGTGLFRTHEFIETPGVWGIGVMVK